MSKNTNKLKDYITDFYNVVEHDIRKYKAIATEVNSKKLYNQTDEELKDASLCLRLRAEAGVSLDELLVEAYALVKEAARRALGQSVFDMQLVSAIAMHKGKLVEVKTGEGKTLAAVMPAYLNALTGKGVHVLTFNDYLAKRDAEWMGSIYQLLGLRVGFINEGMTTEERRAAYSCDVTYVTAKEAGFDYLRDFLCMDKEKLTHREFNYAIIDEADSILIDEARIPLVIAGDISEEHGDYGSLARLARELVPGLDYSADQHDSNVYLTDSGLQRVEAMLCCGNLYEDKNLELLTRINCALFAEALLKRDRDYIVRNGRIEIVDEFTGRVAEKRNWPNSLQHAIEVKENLSTQPKGTILGSIALQYFIGLYPKKCGMTGTASTAAGELKEFYALDVLVIPTNKPCIRKDHSDLIFTHKEAKLRAIVADVKERHQKGQPILIGTGSVSESEELATELRDIGIECQVLNAKNDEMEAQIIAQAGVLGAVTVSTNMAGRGIDILLGGAAGCDKDKICALGGLYVLGAGHYESRRIDNQLKGRAGRQGDPGESRFYVSLEDELIRKYSMDRFIPKGALPQRQQQPIVCEIVARELDRGHRVVEGYNSDVRRQLFKYSFIQEEQRRFIHKKRQEALMDVTAPRLLKQASPERWENLSVKYGEKVLREVEKQLTLYYINKNWADYLDYITYMRESIHLVVIGGKNPLHEYHLQAIEAFGSMLKELEQDIVERFYSAKVDEKGIDLEKEGLKLPSSTWTYLINDDPNQFSRLPGLIKGTINYVKGPLFTLRSLLEGLRNKKKAKS